MDNNKDCRVGQLTTFDVDMNIYFTLFLQRFDLGFKPIHLFILIMHTNPVEDDDMKAYLKSYMVLNIKPI